MLKTSVSGGAGNSGFDRAMLAAMDAVDSTELPAEVRGVHPRDDTPVIVSGLAITPTGADFASRATCSLPLPVRLSK